MKFVKSTLLLGLVLVAPAGLTFWVLVGVIRFFDGVIQSFGLRVFPGMGIFVALGFLFFVGLLGKTFAGRVLKNFFDWILEQLPVVRGLYRLFTQIGDVLFSKEQRNSFKKVVLVPYATEFSEAIAFWVGESKDGKIIVFVPTAPNPTSGFILFVQKQKVRELDMSVEEAFKFILSGGALLANKDQAEIKMK